MRGKYELNKTCFRTCRKNTLKYSILYEKAYVGCKYSDHILTSYHRQFLNMYKIFFICWMLQLPSIFSSSSVSSNTQMVVIAQLKEQLNSSFQEKFDPSFSLHVSLPVR